MRIKIYDALHYAVADGIERGCRRAATIHNAPDHALPFLIEFEVMRAICALFDFEDEAAKTDS